MSVARKTAVVVAVGVMVAGMSVYLALDASRDLPSDTSPSKPMTLAELQKRREEIRQAEPAPAAQTPAAQPSAARALRADSSGITTPDRWSVMKDPTERSMIGLPFQVSESVNRECKQVWMRDCPRLNAFLEHMAAEPRDPEWAGQMEARIERATYEGERGQYRIRALECRSTRCALEVASESKSIGISFGKDRGDDMSPGLSAVAYEHDLQTGIGTSVIVQTWQKR